MNCVLDVGAHDGEYVAELREIGYQLLVGIQSELAVKHCYEGMVGFTDALEEYAALGFEVTGIFPVAHDEDQLRVVEFDCVMVRGETATGPS